MSGLVSGWQLPQRAESIRPLASFIRRVATWVYRSVLGDPGVAEDLLDDADVHALLDQAVRRRCGRRHGHGHLARPLAFAEDEMIREQEQSSRGGPRPGAGVPLTDSGHAWLDVTGRNRTPARSYGRGGVRNDRPCPVRVPLPAVAPNEPQEPDASHMRSIRSAATGRVQRIPSRQSQPASRRYSSPP